MVIQEDIKISVLESLVPAELEKHIQFNRDRFSTMEKALKEISDFMEIRHGHKMNVTNSAPTGRGRGADDMDVGAFHNGGKAGGKRGGKKQGRNGKGSGAETRICHNCNKVGHLASNCWAPGGGAAAKANPKQPPKQPYRPKGDSKGKGFKGKGKGGKGSKGKGRGGKGRKGKKGRHAGSLEEEWGDSWQEESWDDDGQEWPEEAWQAEEEPGAAKDHGYFGLAGATDVDALDLCALTVEESNARSELYKALDKELEACTDDDRTESILEEMKSIEADWAKENEVKEEIPERDTSTRTVSGSSSNCMFNLVEKGMLATMEASIRKLRRKLGLERRAYLKPDDRADDDESRIKDLA